MALIYFDSSVLVKLVPDETGSDIAATLWNASDATLSSRLAYPEVCAALTAAGRNHDLTGAEAAEAAAEWDRFWASMRPVELSTRVEQTARELAARHHLRGAGAVHLASALAVGDPDLIVAVWDKRLHLGAVAAGLAVAPAQLD